MKLTIFLFVAFFLLTNCGDNKAATNESNAANNSTEKKDQPGPSSSQGDNIVGEWKCTMWISDKNRNEKIEHPH